MSTLCARFFGLLGCVVVEEEGGMMGTEGTE